MPIALDFISGSNPGGGTTATLSHTCSGTDRILFVSFRAYKASAGANFNPLTSITYAGISLSAAGARNSPGNDQAVYLYYLINPPAGTANIVATSAATDDRAIRAVSYTGALQSGVPNAYTTAPKTSSALTMTVTTTVDNCWLVGTFVGDSGNSVVASTNTTRRYPTSDAGSQADIFVDSNGPQTPAGLHSMRATTTAFFIYGIMAAFAPAPEPSKSSFFQLF